MGIAFLRGHLESLGIKSSVINFNREIEKKYELNFKNDIKKILKEYGIISEEFNFLKSRLLYFFIIRLYYFGPNLLLKASNSIKIFDKIFVKYDDYFLKNDYIAISLTYSDQVLFSLILIKYIKNNFKNKKIIIGGSLVTSVIEDFLKIFSIEPMVDYIVVGEGETPLEKILFSKGEKQKLINTYYIEEGEYKKSKKQFHFEKYRKLSPPIYEKEDYLMLQYSRNCYWGKCAYCVADHFHYNPKYSNRGVNKIIGDIELNNSLLKSNKNFYEFSDSAIPKVFFENFYEALKKKPQVKNTYSAYVRFDSWVTEKVVKKMKESGFIKVKGGIETSSERLQKKINKGYRLEDILRILDIYKKFDLKVCLMFMIGLPTQTREELYKDLLFIKKILKKYNNVYYVEITPLSIKRGTDLFINPEKYNISILDKRKIFLANHYSFRQLSPNAISMQEAIEMTKKYISKELIDFKKNIYLWI
jgi:radical SAM superfamily enzyme YgiQ (UPF0313 family)